MSLKLEYEGENRVCVTHDGHSLGTEYVNSSIGLAYLLNDMKAVPEAMENPLIRGDTVRVGSFMAMFDNIRRVWVAV